MLRFMVIAPIWIARKVIILALVAFVALFTLTVVTSWGRSLWTLAYMWIGFAIFYPEKLIGPRTPEWAIHIVSFHAHVLYYVVRTVMYLFGASA